MRKEVDRIINNAGENLTLFRSELGFDPHPAARSQVRDFQGDALLVRRNSGFNYRERPFVQMLGTVSCAALQIPRADFVVLRIRSKVGIDWVG